MRFNINQDSESRSPFSEATIFTTLTSSHLTLNSYFHSYVQFKPYT